MKRTNVSKLENKKDVSKPSNLIIILLGLVFIFASINLINDISSWKGIRPFGVISDVLAQVGGYGLNTKKIAKQLDGGGNLLESNDRCEVIDPNKAEIKTASQLSGVALPSLDGNLGGANTSVVLDFGYDEELNTKILNYAGDLNMSYNMGLVTVNNPTSVIGAAKFIKETNAVGMMPIIRLCVAGVCSFKDQNQIVNFYQQVHAITSADEYFIGVVGPNEPGSGEPELEMKGFVDGEDYGALLAETDQVAKALQGLRPGGVNAGHMLIAPAIFNLTNAVNNDVAEYLYSGRTFNPELYDYLLGNTYELSNGTSAHDYYNKGAAGDGDSLKKYADSKDIPVIVSEFGAFFENYQGRRNTALEEQKQSFKKFCDDGNVEGVLFFRSFLKEDRTVALNDELVWKDRHGMTPSEHAEIIGDCPIQKKPGFKDFAWANCNFDSCVYEQPFYSNSFATACGTETENRNFTVDNGAALKVECSGDKCVTRKIGTVEVAMPIKQFGSNSAAGTSSLPFTPICAEVAAYYSNSNIDPLNQYAGALTTMSPGGGSNNDQPDAGDGSVDNNYNDGRERVQNAIALVTDSQGAPGPERGIFMPSEWFANVDRAAAIPGSGAEGFANGTYSVPSNLPSNATIVIWLGTNDCPAFTVAQFQADMNVILNRLAGRNIVLIPVPLRSDGQCSDDVVNSYNSLLRSLANGGSIKYLDVNYSPKSAYLYPDGLHVGNYKPINEGLYALIKNGSAGTVNFTNSQTTQASNQSSSSTTNQSSVNRLVNVDLSTAYPMPWLGSAISCSADLIMASSEFARFIKNDQIINPGSSSLQTVKELNSTENPFGTGYWEEYFGQNGDESLYSTPWVPQGNGIPDEKALCIDSLGVCLDKGKAMDTLKGLRAYLPQNTPSRYKQTSCNTDSIYLDNPANYIIGPEVVVDQVSEVWSGSPGEVCRKYSNRNNTDKDVLAGVDYPSQLGGPTSPQYQAAALDCQVNTKTIVANGSQFYCPNLSAFSFSNFCSPDKIQKGDCSVPSEYAECFTYNPDPEGDEIYIKTDKYPDAPNYNIPGVYDSLYRMYQKLQTQMSERGLKVVFRENLGWKVEVTSKIRDANRSLAESNDRGLPDVVPYAYAQDLNSCSVPSNIFTNDSLLAKNNPTKTEYQYYDWLGYLDVLQELSVAYTKDSTFSAEELIDNPNYGKDSAPNNTRRKVLETGLASITTSFPVLTCDQIEQWKFDENTPVNSSTNPNPASTQFFCPVQNGMCGKGPRVESHQGLNSAIDIFNTKYTDENSEQTVVAPFDGKIVGVQTRANYCQNGTGAGGSITYEGIIDGKSVRLYFLHVLVDDSVKSGNTYKAGDRITRVSKLSDPDMTPANEGGCIGIQGPHLHMEVLSGGYNVTGFAQALGCSMNGASGVGYKDYDNYGDSCNVASPVTLGSQSSNSGPTPLTLTENPEAQIKPDDKLTCITDSADKRFDDELGEFLCSKGYKIEGLCDEDALCKKPEDEDTGTYYCPATGGYCLQGPFDKTISHGVLNAVDIYGTTVVAPMDGTVVKADNNYNYCANGTDAGGSIWFQGEINGQTTTLFMFHVDASNASELEGRSFQAGETITTTIKPCVIEVASDGSYDSAKQQACKVAGTPIYYSGNIDDAPEASSCIGPVRHIHMEVTGNDEPYARDKDYPIAELSLGKFGCAVNQNSADSCAYEPTLSSDPVVGDYCGEVCEVLPETKPVESDLLGGVKYAILDKKSSFFATTPDSQFQSLGDFVSGNGVDFAINTSLYASDLLGLNGGDGKIQYVKPEDRFFRIAFVEYKGSLKESDNVRIKFKNDKFAFIDITNWFDKSDVQIQAIIKDELGSVVWAITGSGIYGTDDGYKATDEYQGITGVKNHRTIVGVKPSGDVVMAVLASADLADIIEAFKMTGMSYGTILDGGGSTMMYSSEGFANADGSTYFNDGNLYIPRGEVRNVAGYLGVRSNGLRVCTAVTSAGKSAEVSVESIRNLCSPASITYDAFGDAKNITTADVERVYNAMIKIVPAGANNPRLKERIREILDYTAQPEVDVNPGFLFALMITEGSVLGDNRAGKVDSRIPVGYDFGCGLSGCGITDRLLEQPAQSLTDARFDLSLQCAAGRGCPLYCRYEGILASTPEELVAIQKQMGAKGAPLYNKSPGLGGFLECFGPLDSGNPNFARVYTEFYDILFNPNDTNDKGRRVDNGQCVMKLTVPQSTQ